MVPFRSRKRRKKWYTLANRTAPILCIENKCVCSPLVYHLAIFNTTLHFLQLAVAPSTDVKLYLYIELTLPSFLGM